jgi:hypothetical protein
MKKAFLTLTVLFTMTQTSHALITQGRLPSDCRNPAVCTLLTTTSLPTLLVGTEDELSDSEKEEFILSEAQNLVDGITTESLLLQKVADETGKDVMTVAKEILLVGN